MRFEDWTRLWEALASASQKDMQFFIGIEKPVTLYQSTLAYVDPTCPCQPGYEEWAFIDKAVPGHDEKGHVCLFLEVSQPATFRVLFWYDPDGVLTDDSDENAPRYWYEVSIPFGLGCSWVTFPEDDGEFLCCFDNRRIQIIKKIATIQEAKERTLSSQLKLPEHSRDRGKESAPARNPR